MTSVQRKEYNKAYYESHKAYYKAYYESRKEEYRAHNKTYYENHKEEYRAHNKAYHENHKAERQAYLKAYYAKKKMDYTVSNLIKEGAIRQSCDEMKQPVSCSANTEISAMQFLKDYHRLCQNHRYCATCPLLRYNCDVATGDDKDNAELIQAVHDWAKEHPEDYSENI